MDRLLTLRLRSTGCTAEARINDITVARTVADATLCVSIHEYLIEGSNEVSLHIDAADASGIDARPVVPQTAMAASLQLLLQHVGRATDEEGTQTLLDLPWTAAPGRLHKPPVVVRRVVTLPIKLPRWRWLDVPALDETRNVPALLATFVQALAAALAQGDADRFVEAARLRFEDIAVAYQQPASVLVERWRSRIDALHAANALQLVLPMPDELLILRCAGGRLAEVVSPTGEPALRTLPNEDGSCHAWPIRVAVVGGRCHVMR